MFADVRWVGFHPPFKFRQSDAEKSVS